MDTAIGIEVNHANRVHIIPSIIVPPIIIE